MQGPSRVPWDLEETALARATAQARDEGRPLLDLVEANPARAALRPDTERVLRALCHPAVLDYEPEPAGLPTARRAVAAYYRDHRAAVGPDQVLLTASTSEAYAWLFKVLCEPGDPVAVPRPSYPLFEFLTAVEAVSAVDYELRLEDRWRIDLASVRAALEQGARAVLVVQPSNPVASWLDPDERKALVQLCARHEAALIVDEVFLDYAPEARTLAGEAGCDVFVLSGLSKVCALPQLKCGWIVASGPRAAEWLARLEVVADTFLSVNTPVQLALPALLADRHPVQNAIRLRLEHNRGVLRSLRGPHAPWSEVTPPDGWYAVLRVPATRGDEGWALAALERDVIVHPGHLYALAGTHLVLSLLPEPDVFRAGLERLVSLLDAGVPGG